MKFLLMMANDIPKILKQEVIDLEKIKNVIFFMSDIEPSHTP